MITSSRNVKFYITNHLKPLYSRLLVLMHGAKTAFRNRHDAPNIFQGSARPLLDATCEWHNIISCGGLMFIEFMWSKWISSTSSHSAVSWYKWSRSIYIITIISLCRRAAIRTGCLFSTCSWCMLTVGWGGLRRHSFLWFVALLMEAWYMPHTEQQRLLRFYLLWFYRWTVQIIWRMMNSPIFSFWIMLFSNRFTKIGKKLGVLSTHLSALDVTMPWPLCFAGTGLGKNGHGSRFWSEQVSPWCAILVVIAANLLQTILARKYFFIDDVIEATNPLPLSLLVIIGSTPHPPLFVMT